MESDSLKTELDGMIAFSPNLAFQLNCSYLKYIHVWQLLCI